MLTRDEVLAHVRAECRGVFTEEAIERHVDEHVGLDMARTQVEWIRSRAPSARDVLDIGSGFGSFVLAARDAGLDATGVEPADFEVRYARERLAEARPGDDAARVYRQGSGLALPFANDSFDVVTLWNVVEHVADSRRLLDEAMRVLRPGGRLYVLAPNYAAVRREAHYHVPWPGLLPRRLAVRYLRLLGRDPRFFAEHIFYCTNRGVLRHVAGRGATVRHLGEHKLERPESIGREPVRRAVALAQRLGIDRAGVAALRLALRNPMRPSIAFEAVMPGAATVSDA
jgi:SAM-dependent methyltransferase